MSEQVYKYTDDGRKVIVISQLNEKETIVQEIMVSGGKEIPSGKNIIANHLLDAPVESWREKKLREIEQRFELRQKEIEKRTNMLEKEHNKVQSELSAIVRAKLHMRDNIKIEALDTLWKFLDGRITHMVIAEYYRYQILTFQEATSQNDRHDTTLKLISLFGRSDGDLAWRINQYSDNSGSWTNFIPCQSLEEAKDLLIKAIQENAKTSVTSHMLEAEQKYGIDALTPVQRQIYHDKCEQGKRDRIEKLQKEIRELEAKIA